MAKAIRERESDVGRLHARPGAPTRPGAPGLLRFGPEGERNGLLYLPAGHSADLPAPLALMLHGAGGTARQAMSTLMPLADVAGLVILAPDSADCTWDVVVGGYGPDVERIDHLLGETFARCAVDAERMAVGGFSDGATYALSLGITNGDLFTHLLAFSPGFLAPAARRGSPRVFVSHGTEDRVLPIDRCSRRIVPRLQRAGYDLVYHEFEGGHTVPPAIALQGLAWLHEPASDAAG